MPRATHPNAFLAVRSTSCIAVIYATFIFAGNQVAAEDVSDATRNTDTWRIGMSAAFSGPASALGNGMRVGIESYFESINRQGGVAGRTLELITIDDAYEPSMTAPNMRRLIDQHNVLCVIGNVGTPTAAVAVPIANEKRVPMFGAFTGAGLLRRTPPDRYVINYRASYAEETARMIEGLVNELQLSPNEIGFFTQNDAYGDAGWKGAVAALKEIGFADAEFLPHGRYTRNTIDVEDGLSRLMDPRETVKAVVMVGAYKPCARFIKLARKHGFNPIFLNVSFVGSSSLVTELGQWGDGVIITQVVPTPNGTTEAAAEFRDIVPAQHQNFVSFEGYLVGKAFVESLRLAGNDATSETLIDAVESNHAIDLGLGIRHRLDKHEHQFSHQIWPTSIRDGQLVLLEDWNQSVVDAKRFEVQGTNQ
ncbi:ABC transporter substrate-binding protein [Roseiconus lacunae]|uniref:ABC transporter substrate-binding protein n=1 Tax=Roseiconus lacunae TaxID=2605694 RepID=A0ABT7PFW5_9BACT|nr:ABC transporter substrate-binding protein [Roseiconus lacunae]MDM4015389.1 ABC transporter substrate-binding protein [Roseiconus lacunae]WRQ52933.1 ABC transporter substrate-binding protein [Stieleria sp. HD01]